MTTTEIKAYESGDVYIMDVKPGDEDGSDFDISSVHDQKNKIIEKLFRKHTQYKIHRVTFPPRSKPEAVVKYFEDELSDKTKDDLVVIYFHGGGGENGEDYCW